MGGDMRAPHVHHVCTAPYTPFLTRVTLTGRAPVPELVQQKHRA